MGAEHLQLLRELAQELERAMDAIAQNSLSELERSIARQEGLSLRLYEVVAERKALEFGSQAELATADAELHRQIQTAAADVRTLNLRYSILLQNVMRSVDAMVRLFHSARGEVQEGAGAGLQRATWSCHV